MSKSMSTRIRFLGTSGSVATTSRANAAFALDLGSEIGTWLVDAGPGTLERLDRFDVGLDSIEHIFLTHQHGDHMLGIPLLNNARWESGEHGPLTIHGPRPTLSAIEQVTRLAFPDQRQRLKDSVEFHSHSAARPSLELVAGVRVRTVAAAHNVPAVAYRFDTPGGPVVFSGDTAPSDEIARLAEGARLLVHDATFSPTHVRPNPPGHSTAREAGQVAARAGVERLALVHLSPRVAANLDEALSEARAVFNGHVFIPDDGFVLTL